MDLENRTALVTGGAKRVGRVIAVELARAGMDVIVHYNRSADAAAETAALIGEVGRTAHTVQADLADPDATGALFERRVDLLVNNASALRKGDFLETTPAEWDQVMAVNLRAPFLTTQHLARGLIERGVGGAVVNIGDMMGSSPDSSYPDHSVSKAALLMLTKVSAKALGQHNIRVNAVVPGPVYRSEHISEERWQAIGSHVALGRPGRPENVAQAILALASNDYITGAVLHVDGGDSLISMQDLL